MRPVECFIVVPSVNGSWFVVTPRDCISMHSAILLHGPGFNGIVSRFKNMSPHTVGSPYCDTVGIREREKGVGWERERGVRDREGERMGEKKKVRRGSEREERDREG